jgi:hypothetical protein
VQQRLTPTQVIGPPLRRRLIGQAEFGERTVGVAVRQSDGVAKPAAIHINELGAQKIIEWELVSLIYKRFYGNIDLI